MPAIILAKFNSILNFFLEKTLELVYSFNIYICSRKSSKNILCQVLNFLELKKEKK